MTGSDSLCVYCRRRPADPAWRPFCGERCKVADLGRWLSEDYRVPAGTEAGTPAVPRPDTPDDEEA